MWEGEKPIVYSIKRPKDIWDFIKNPRNDKQIVLKMWKLLDEADIVIAHNALKFDLKKVNSRFLFYNLPPPSPYQVVDTLTAIKKVSSNTRNNLDALLKRFGLGQKLEHEGWGMWLKCKQGLAEGWRKMEEYNKRDVVGLQKLYNYILPWVQGHPNVAMFSDGMVCSKCGSAKGFGVGGWKHNKTTKYKVWRCKNCRGLVQSPGNYREIKPLISI